MLLRRRLSFTSFLHRTRALVVNRSISSSTPLFVNIRPKNKHHQNMSCCNQNTGCCGGGSSAAGTAAASLSSSSSSPVSKRAKISPDHVDQTTVVREGYAKIANEGETGCTTGCCGASSTPIDADEMSHRLGYDLDELKTILPKGSNLGLGCGNPLKFAALKAGERVVDLGSGGGIDVFLAADKVKPNGKVIGVDMTPEMISKARANAKSSPLNSIIEFRLGEIEHLPLANSEVDVVLSNCVVNLCSDKQQVWNETYRVLKEGGRLSIEDVCLLRPLPPSVKSMTAALIGCFAGASLVSETKAMLEKAGFVDVKVVPHDDFVRALRDANDDLYLQIQRALPVNDNDLTSYVVSGTISAVKKVKNSGGGCC